MATKAEEYMAELIRQSRPPRPKKLRKPTRDESIDTTLLDGVGTSPHNFAKRSDNRGGPVLESSASGKASRKSTRKSSGHMKAATPHHLAFSARSEGRSPVNNAWKKPNGVLARGRTVARRRSANTPLASYGHSSSRRAVFEREARHCCRLDF
jgi:hypothetical protein